MAEIGSIVVLDTPHIETNARLWGDLPLVAGMWWTVTPPTVPGWYWAYEDLPPEDADVICVNVLSNGHNLFASALECSFELSDFTHWLGPLLVPTAPEAANG